MSREEDAIAQFFNAGEITVTLSRRQLQRLYNLLRQTSEETEERLSKQDPANLDKVYVEDTLQNHEDRSTLAYLESILSQNS